MKISAYLGAFLASCFSCTRVSCTRFLSGALHDENVPARIKHRNAPDGYASLLGISKKLIPTAAFLFASVSLAGQLDYELNFERSLEFNCSGNCPTVSGSVAREGSRSMRSAITKNSSGNSYRSEVVIPGLAKNLEYEKDYWYGFSSYLPSSWEVSYKYELIAQFHSALDPWDEKGIGPPVSIRSGRNGDWEIVSRKEGDTRGKSRIWTLNSVWEDVGKWTDWVIHYKPSFGPNGVLQVWKDGALVVDHYGPNAMDDQRGPYFKMGIYKPYWKNEDNSGRATKTIHHDALRIASGPNASYFDVAPKGGAAPAVVEQSSPETVVPTPSVAENESGASVDGGSVGGERVEITNLSDGQSVSGTFKVVVDARDPTGVRKVTLRVDDNDRDLLIGTRTVAPWEFDVNTADFRSGNRLRIKAVMHDGDGQRTHDVIRVQPSAQSGAGVVGLSTGGSTEAEQQSPAPQPQSVESATSTDPQVVSASSSYDGHEEYLKITNLTSQQSVSGVVQVLIEAHDPEGISKIVLWADDKVTETRVGEKTAPPWEFRLDTSDFRSGERLRVKAVMRDARGGKFDYVVRVYPQ